MGLSSILIIDIARISIEKKILDNIDWLPDLSLDKYKGLKNKQGAFTTLYDSEQTLRGCIGVPYPDHPLAHAIAISARNSATKDPRFKTVISSELSEITIEVEALSSINQIKFDNLDMLHDQIEIGIHGLLIKNKSSAGLLLPQVAKRYNWSKEEYLQNICRKAMLPFDTYMHPDTKLYSFTSTHYK